MGQFRDELSFDERLYDIDWRVMIERHKAWRWTNKLHWAGSKDSS